MDQVLKRFVDNPKKLREQLGKSDAPISGSLALQLFECCSWGESDMDVFIKAGTGAVSFAAYVKDAEKYRLVTTRHFDSDDYNLPDLVAVRSQSSTLNTRH